MARAVATTVESGFINAMGLAHRWRYMIFRGLVAIAFGIYTFARPQRSLAVLILFFGAWAIADGVLDLVLAARSARHGKRWGTIMAAGVAGIAAGVLTFIWPGITALILLMIIAAWAIVTGILEIVAAVRLRKQIRGEWLLALSGAVSIAFGLLVFFRPGTGALALLLWIGAFAIVHGGLLVGLGLKLRSWAHSTERKIPTGGMPQAA